jgi:hypothetical protein
MQDKNTSSTNLTSWMSGTPSSIASTSITVKDSIDKILDSNPTYYLTYQPLLLVPGYVQWSYGCFKHKFSQYSSCFILVLNRIRDYLPSVESASANSPSSMGSFAVLKSGQGKGKLSWLKVYWLRWWPSQVSYIRTSHIYLWGCTGVDCTGALGVAASCSGSCLTAAVISIWVGIPSFGVSGVLGGVFVSSAVIYQ